MQKKIIALAVAGLVSGAAFAQSNVTIYGVADAYYAYSRGDVTNFSGINSGGLSGSRLGFKGEEALGNGLKAIFTWEFGSLNLDQALNVDNGGNGALGTRQSFVGLSSGFGTVSAGRQYAPSYLYLGGSSSNEVTVVNPSNYFVPAFVTLQTGNGARWNNSIAYTSPSMGGLEARAIYAFGENSAPNGTTINATGVSNPALQSNADTSDGGRIGLGVRYNNGPFYATAIYQAVQENDSTVALEKNRAWALGGSFDLKVVKLYANYIQEKFNNAIAGGSPAVLGVPTAGLAANGEAKKKFWSVGVGVPVGAMGSVTAEYAHYKVGEATEVNAKGLGVGYNHSFSKRTTGYINVSRITNGDNASFGGQTTTGNGSANFRGSTASPSGTAIGTNAVNNFVATNGESNTNFGIGVRHVF